MTKVFIIPFHVQRLEQSVMPPDLSGAYVSCYAAGSDYVDATQKALRQLSADGLHPLEILQPIFEMSSDGWTDHIRERWADHVASLPTQVEFEEAIQSNKVVYGPFGSYA